METTHDQQRAIAFIVRAEQQPERLTRDVDGFIMFCRGHAVESETEQMGRGVDDFFDLAADLPLDSPYPAFMVWEGDVRFTEDDYYTSGKWRRARGSEIIACAQGRNPFPSPEPVSI